VAIPDAQPIAGLATATPGAASAAPAPSTAGAVPGGVGGDIPSVFREVNLSPAIVLAALATAIGLGAFHALTPGHGKTLMAAYLVGARGTRVQAAGLGLSIAVAHTIGVLALAVLVIVAETTLPPDLVARRLPMIAALTIVAFGAWMLFGEIRRRRVAVPDHTHADEPATAQHSHGGATHSHAATAGAITWRGLLALGLAGGIVPSASALLILLGTIVAGHAAFGVVLVIAFGVGMALVMTGVGLSMIYARGRFDRLTSSARLGRFSGQAPLVAGIVVLVLGVWLTVQAVAGAPVF
jgi:nickel/cobalt transporter (NicO) family protein